MFVSKDTFRINLYFHKHIIPDEAMIHSSKIIYNKVPDASQSVSQSVYSPGLLHYEYLNIVSSLYCCKLKVD